MHRDTATANLLLVDDDMQLRHMAAKTLRHAIKAGQLRLHFQPKKNAHTGAWADAGLLQQGFLFSKPLPPEAFESLMRSPSPSSSPSPSRLPEPAP